jgi:hypothetical protein
MDQNPAVIHGLGKLKGRQPYWNLATPKRNLLAKFMLKNSFLG